MLANAGSVHSTQLVGGGGSSSMAGVQCHNSSNNMNTHVAGGELQHIEQSSLDCRKHDCACEVMVKFINKETHHVYVAATLSWDQLSKHWLIRNEATELSICINYKCLDFVPCALENNDLLSFNVRSSKKLIASFYFVTSGKGSKSELDVDAEYMMPELQPVHQPDDNLYTCTANFTVWNGRKRSRSISIIADRVSKHSCARSTTDCDQTNLKAKHQLEDDCDEGKSHKCTKLLCEENLEELTKKTPGFNDVLLELSCSICTEIFYKSNLLECGHTFCKDCLDKWLVQSLTCPICRAAVCKQPVPSLSLDKAIEMMAQHDEEKMDCLSRKKQASEERLRKSVECKHKLEMVLAHAQKSGFKLVSISRPWSEKEQLRFLKGVKSHYGPSRFTYCESVSLTPDFVLHADKDQLLTAVQNLRLTPQSGKRLDPEEMTTDSCWKEATASELRNRLLLFINFS